MALRLKYEGDLKLNSLITVYNMVTDTLYGPMIIVAIAVLIIDAIKHPALWLILMPGGIGGYFILAGIAAGHSDIDYRGVAFLLLTVVITAVLSAFCDTSE